MVLETCEPFWRLVIVDFNYSNMSILSKAAVVDYRELRARVNMCVIKCEMTAMYMYYGTVQTAAKEKS